MCTEKVAELLLLFKNFVPEDRMSDLEFFFSRLGEEHFDAVRTIKLKSPKLTILLSATLGFLGADRFYVNDTVGGIQKLLFSLITLGVWPLVDIFITFRLCKEENYLTITESIKDFI